MAVGHSTACRKGAGSAGIYLLVVKGEKSANRGLPLLVLSYLGNNKAAFSQGPRLLLQMEAVDKFAISLVPSSRLTFASLVTLQQFLIF